MATVRRKAVRRESFVHPTTGATWRFSLMDDGGLEVKVEHDERMEYVVRHVFQANTNSQISVRLAER